MSEARKAYSKAFYAANKPYFAAYRKANSGKLARYSSDYYRKNQLRYAEGQRFCKRLACAWAGRRPPLLRMWA